MAIYVKFDGIEGEATHEAHKKWIELTSLQWGVDRAIMTKPGAALNREASEPSVNEVTVTKPMDGASTKLVQQACTGEAGKKVVIHVVTTGNPGDTFLEYTLNETLVSSYSVSTSGDRPMESIRFNFTKLEMKYTPFDADHKPGSPIVASYDLTTTKSG